MDGIRVFKPPLRVRDWRLAYGIACARIYNASQRVIDATGRDPLYTYPTEEEFRALRRRYNARAIYRKDA